MMHTQKSGFTLIELSIVLVIIGLIVGGVLVGRDLIRAAEIRGTVAQVEKIGAAVNTFRNKYNGLPGDFSTAANFGMQARSGAAGHGDGNSYLESCNSGVATANTAGCETVLFWRDLSFANLVEGSFSTATDALAVIAPGGHTLYFPSAKIGTGAVFLVFYTEATSNLGTATDMPAASNYFAIVSNPTTDASGPFGAGVYSLAPTFSPMDAKQMDDKMDDGSPYQGMTRVLRGDGSNLAGGETINDTPGVDNGYCQEAGYYQGDPDRQSKRCNLTIKAPF